MAFATAIGFHLPCVAERIRVSEFEALHDIDRARPVEAADRGMARVLHGFWIGVPRRSKKLVERRDGRSEASVIHFLTA